MLYQKMLIGNKPYLVSVSRTGAFEVHRHPEIEISFCLDGEYELICEHKRYCLSAGDLVVVPPMCSHEIPGNDHECKKLTIELGSAILGECFDFFSKLNASAVFFKNADFQTSEQHRELVHLMRETAALHQSNLFFRELSIKGNLYKISSLLLQILNFSEPEGTRNKKMTDIKKVDQALEKIYNSYYEPLTVEEVSAFCGYNKSNFCKIFKSITGSTFHHILNRHRVEVACMLLRESDRTVEEIARETGFADSKSFCRVFKKITGQNAGAYRKSQKHTGKTQEDG